MTGASARQLAGVLAELDRRRAGVRLAHYNTGGRVHHKQLAFHQCARRNRWIFGGNRTGKTECGAVEAVWHARGCHRYRTLTGPTEGWIVSPTLEVQRDVAQKKVLQYLDPAWIVKAVMRKGRASDPGGGVLDYLLIQSQHGGVSRIGFKSADQGRESFQGASLHWIWFDEEPPADIYAECAMRVLDKKGDIWATMTPLQGRTWVYETIWQNRFSDPEIWHSRMTWADNPFLDPEEVGRLEGAFAQSDLATRRDGHFADAAGLVYPEFDEALHVIAPFAVPAAWYDRIAIDPGLVNPLSAHWYACDGDGTVYAVAEHYRAGWTVERHAQAIHAQCKILGWPCDNRGRVRALFDPAVQQRTLAGERSAAELFLDHNILPETKVRKDVWTGIQRVREYLRPRPADDTAAWPRGKPRLLIFNTCVHMIEEMRGYRYAKNGESPDKHNDHAMDELRYYLMSRPEPARPTAPPPNPVQRDLAVLARQAQRRRWRG